MAALKKKQRRKRLLGRRKRVMDIKTVIDHKRPDILKRFVTERGKIIPRRVSGASAKQQRKICIAVKRARFLGILPYAISHRGERGFSGMVSLSYNMFDRQHRYPKGGRGGPRGDRGDSRDRGGPRGDRDRGSPRGDRADSRDRGGPKIERVGEKREAPTTPAPAATSTPTE
jgi:small subunit ribosomal protein S18